MNKKIRLSNIPSDWALHLALFIGQPIAIALTVAFGDRQRWETWVFVAVIGVSFVYFGAMFFYKLYRSRLTFLTIDENGATLSHRFKPYRIPSDKMRLELTEYKKSRGNRDSMYVRLYDENVETPIMLSVKRVKKLSEVAPPPFIRFFTEISDTVALKTALETANERALPYIREEIAERERAAEDAKRNEAERRRAQNKHKKRKKHKK